MEQKDTKSEWKLIGWLKKVGRLKVVVFYEELPINGTLVLKEVDKSLKQIIWKADKKLLSPLKESRYLYFKKNGENYVLPVIAFNDKEIVTSFPVIATEKKLNRKYVRVKTTEKDPVDIMIGNTQLPVEDISETGAGILVPEDKARSLEENKRYTVMLRIRGEFLKLNGVVVRKKEQVSRGEKLVDIGMEFEDVKQKDKERLSRYVIDRQREIAKKIFLSKD